jgi:hypothetical protein
MSGRYTQYLVDEFISSIVFPHNLISIMKYEYRVVDQLPGLLNCLVSRQELPRR